MIILVMVKLSAAGDIKFTASVDKTFLAPDDNFRYTVEVSGPIGSLPTPNLPDFKQNFYILAGPSESTSYQIINRDMSASKSITYVLQPRKTGFITIPPAYLTYQKKRYRTETIKITISSSGTPSKGGTTVPSDKADDSKEVDIFLRAEPDKTTLVQNDAVIINYRIYFRVNISSYEITKLPTTAGFWKEDFELPRQPIISQETVNGVRYQVATIGKVALFPTKPGKLTIEPLEIQCRVQTQHRTRSRDFFDRFLDDPFFRGNYQVPRYFQSQPITLNVLPYPEKSRPEDFSGAVGSFRLDASIDSDSVQANEPLTLTVKVSGRGNIRMIQPPEINISPDFERYEPEIDIETIKSGRVISGSKTFKYLLVPRFPGRQKIDPVRFSFYDPKRKRYAELQSEGFEVMVSRGKEVLMAGGVSISPDEVKLYGHDISFIKTEGRLKPMGSLLYLKTGYYLAYIIPLFIFIGGGIFRSYYLHRNPDLIRRRNAFRKAKACLDRAEKLSSPGGGEDFFREIGEGLKCYIADKMSVSSAGLVLEALKEQILGRGVSPHNLEILTETVVECDMGRFSSSMPEIEERKKLIEKARKSLQQMESEWKGHSA